ncbi:MAG: hypothetical protein HC825_03940 [Oscillatoriales cyanobacterium RM1_1_9]|nr:hypothetical protein [Oscillatoriales cyanobacterium SM2_3_0]NJO46982.1 hypothetical protein [Oscillatoriales cyanobacterium RM2_1_1]NJO71075.1 hypothetical protein [Oscillatoriales cyanobacterium RM1_1_9]
MVSKDLFAREALAQIPKILTLLDRNPHSPTYGCFDRNFWHYKIIDFPSGMAQEFVWPLALAYEADLPGNPYYQQPRIKDWVEAGILFAVRAAHPDGSCDDYFPYERATGATAFSLLACLESYVALGLMDYETLQFFERRANWLANHHESGQLANHEALIILCLERLGQVLQTPQWRRLIAARLEKLLSWQSEEGWFTEYEGCDPGYQTLTISCLARLQAIRPDPRLQKSLVKAVELAAHFIHPDGTYGGEYTSRNTYNFFPHGFELVGQWLPDALRINDRFLQGLNHGLSPCYADDHIIGHHTWNYLLAWRDFVPERPIPKSRDVASLWLKKAQILIKRRPNVELYIALNKGGVFKLFRDNKLLISDTQISLQVRQGKYLKNAVGHLVSPYEITVEQDEITIAGRLGWAKQTQMSPWKLIVLRLVMLSVGRFFPDLIRKTLQKILITGKQLAPFQFKRQFLWENNQWHILDHLYADSWQDVTSAGIDCAQTSIYVVMSRTFQSGQLQPWIDLMPQIQRLNPGQPLMIKRSF